MTVSAKGWIYAADERTGAVHVFDDRGKHLQVDRPDAKDYKGSLSMPSLTVSDHGDVYVTRHDYDADKGPDFIHYTPTGKRAGVESISLEEDGIQKWFAQPGSTNRWVLGYAGAYLIDAKGALLRKLDRTASGQSLENPRAAGVAPNRSIAIVSGVNERLFGILPMDTDKVVLTLFSANGTPVATTPAPDGLDAWSGSIAFDGMQLAYLIPSDKSNKQTSILVTDLHGKPRLRLLSTSSSYRSKIFLVTRNTGREMWLYDGKTTIDRYALH